MTEKRLFILSAHKEGVAAYDVFSLVSRSTVVPVFGEVAGYGKVVAVGLANAPE